MTTTAPHPASDAGSGTKAPVAVVVIADKFDPSGAEALERLGCAVHADPDLTPEKIPEAVARFDPHVLVVRGTRVTADVFTAASRLSLVVRAGAGYDAIDVPAASSRGIFVANCPGRNAIAVAELAWGLILSCDRRIPDQTADLRAGRWRKKEYSRAAGLYGRTLGIVGLGQIGQEIARRGRAFGMKVVAWSRSLTEERADALGVGYCSNLINLAKMSDVVAVSVAANDQTRHLVNEQFCQALPPHAFVINTSRGSVVDEAALVRAIREKGLRAGLDVFADEPGGGSGEFQDAIVQEPGVYGTHHVGASTDQAQAAIAAEAVRVVREYLITGQVPNCVNRALATSATTLLTVRHLNRPGVLAHVFYTLGQAGINVEEMENIIYDGAEAACARIQLDNRPGDDHVNAIRANEHVLSASLASLSS